MDADIQIMVGTVQTDCQVCDSVTLSFLTYGLRHLCQSFIQWSVVFPFALLHSNMERGAELLLGQALVQMGINFSLAGGASSHQTAKVKLVLPFHTVDRSFGGNRLNSSLLSSFILILV